MFELVEGFLDVCGHVDLTSPFVVVPIKGETTIKGASPVDGDSIQLHESLDEMVSSFFDEVFDTEVVDHNGEEDIFGGMLLKERGLSERGVTKPGKVDMEHIVCNAAGLFQAWYAFADLQVHPSVGCELAEVVLGDDFFRKYVQDDLHILILRPRGIRIKKLISRVRTRAWGVEMVLFKRHLVFFNMAQLVVLLPVNSNLFPLTVTRTRCVLVL